MNFIQLRFFLKKKVVYKDTFQSYIMILKHENMKMSKYTEY